MQAPSDREKGLTPQERALFDQLVRDSELKSAAAKRGLALDYVLHGRLLADIDARARASCSLLDDPKHANAAVSNRRRLLESLKVTGEKEPELGGLLGAGDDDREDEDVQTSTPVDADDLLGG